MTGAPIPPGCDAVVMHERTRAAKTACVIVEPAVKAGQNMLPRGREMRAGEVVVAAWIDPASRLGWGFWPRSAGPRSESCRGRWSRSCPPATSWSSPARCRARARSATRTPSCSMALAIRGRRLRRSLPIAPDDARAAGGDSRARARSRPPAGHRGRLGRPARSRSGGARRPGCADASSTRSGLKPGKPLWFGVGPPRGDRPPALVFGLPGNPVSGLVGFLLFVRPALAVLAGKPEPCSGSVRARLASAFCPSRRPDHLFSHRRLVDPGADAAGLAVDRNPRLAGLGRSAHRRRRRRFRHFSRPAIANTARVKLSTSSP